MHLRSLSVSQSWKLLMLYKEVNLEKEVEIEIEKN